MKAAALSEHRWSARDGAELTYYRVGEGGRPLLLANGVLGGPGLWAPQFEYLGDRYRWVSWDYRGVGKSTAPEGDAPISVEDHARDALGIMDAEGIDSTAVIGWSFGVQVALEIVRRAPRRVALLILVGGGAMGPWSGRPVAKHIAPRVVRGAHRFASLLQGGLERVAQWPETLSWAKRAGLVSPMLDEELWHQVVRSAGTSDVGKLLDLIESMGSHDASRVLPEINVPTLVISGDRDPLGTREAAEHIARTVRDAELMMVPGGGFFVAAEYPEIVNLRMEKFMRERGYADPVPSRRPSPPA